MRRALVRFTIAPDLPPLIQRLPEATILAPFGRWLRERVASHIPDWPAVGFHRIEITADGLEVLLVAGGHARAEAQFVAVMRAVWRDTTRGAVRCGWTSCELWVSAEVHGEERESEKARKREGAVGALVPSEGRGSVPTMRDPSLRSG